MLAVRWRLLQQFLALPNKAFFQFRYWHNRFFGGVVVTGLMLGCGAALAMSYVTPGVQIIFHATLLIMCAGAIAYLSTSFQVYISYMVTLITPVTIWLMLQQNPASYVLSCLYVFFMIAGWISVKRMNELVHDALYYRYDNEALIEDLERLLASVSQSNKALEKISTTDEVTGISNYRAFRVQLEDVWRQYRGKQLQVSLIKLNIDDYHEFNAHYGQEAGDRYLREIAGSLSSQVSHKSQLAARLHGAEFALLLPGVSCENARKIALEVKQQLDDKKIENLKSSISPYLTLSLGLGSQTVAPESTSRELLVRTDTALWLAQQRGHDRLEILEG